MTAQEALQASVAAAKSAGADTSLLSAPVQSVAAVPLDPYTQVANAYRLNVENMVHATAQQTADWNAASDPIIAVGAKAAATATAVTAAVGGAALLGPVGGLAGELFGRLAGTGPSNAQLDAAMAGHGSGSLGGSRGATAGSWWHRLLSYFGPSVRTQH